MTSIHYVQYDAAHPSYFVYNVPEGLDCWLLVITQTPALFEVRGEIREYPANCAVLYPPFHKIYYRACEGTYVNDWVRFDATDSYILECPLPLGVPFPVPDPGYCHQLFQLLVSEHLWQSDYYEISVDHLFRVLFNKLYEAAKFEEHAPQYHRLLQLRKELYHNPGHPWTVKAMADYVHLSPGYLQTLYKSTFGISCMEDVIQCRIRLAKEKLVYGPAKVADIAALCGYANIEHFCRQFRQVTGCTPRAYRNARANSGLTPRLSEG